MSRELLFSVTAADCRFEYSRGTGPGGQKRNKTSSKVRCVHKASGAAGGSDDTRSQHRNKRIAFRRMAESEKFTTWHKLESARVMGKFQDIEEQVDRSMGGANLRVELKRQGLWIEE